MKPKPQEKTKKATDHPTERHWREMNRKQRREMMRKIQSEDLSLEVVHPDAAGIDIGNESHYVAVPPSRDSQPVRRFGCTTAELKAMAVSIDTASGRLVAGVPHALFQTRIIAPRIVLFQYAVAPDGKRFLINSLPSVGATPLTVMIN